MSGSGRPKLFGSGKLAQFSEPARSMRAIRCRHIQIKMLAPGPVLILDGNEPVAGPPGRLKCAIASGRGMPGQEPMHDLGSIKDRRHRTVLGDFESRKGAIGMLE